MGLSRTGWMLAGLLLLVAGLSGYGWIYQHPQAPAASGAAIPPPPAPEFVGRAVCAGCHAEQDRLWQGSHHDLAMQEANAQTVLGNFNDAEFRKDGVVSRFFRRDGRFWVNTDGPDGQLADFQIKYSFGVTPLQQYLVELPGGRLQALSIAWDSRPEAQGGQRWFHLYPQEKIDHNDELHWTKHAQNWNFMCAECHSTHLLKNYDPATRSYRTTWSEINVACEACHGPGSRHVAWANSKDGREQLDGGTLGLVLRLDERRGVHWSMNPQSGHATRSQPRASSKEIDTCAPCHARRGQWFGGDQPGQSWLNSHLPALLREGLYHPDGQIDGEVYEYGSFLQSRMYQAGVTCSDCHEPHSLKLRLENNGVCLQCHAADKYASTAHHHHRENGPGSRCVECHAPTKTYMGVDPRRDHSFRVPRPDLSATLGTPNPCAQCHARQPARWAADTVRQWLGHDPKGYQDYAEILHAARHGLPGTEAGLLALMRNPAQPAIARATAAAELGRWLSPDGLPTLAEALNDADPLVKLGSLEALQALPPDSRWRLAHGVLRDPSRVVRALAGEALSGIDSARLSPSEQAELQQALADNFAAQYWNADDPGAEVNRGNLLAARGDYAAAEAAYREALRLNPDWVPAYINLADVCRRLGRDGEGEAVLRAGLVRQPQAAALHHGLGLLEIRRGNIPAALVSLQQAVMRAPGNARFAYVYAIALDSTGRRRDALKVVQAGLKQVPGDGPLAQLLSLWSGQAR